MKFSTHELREVAILKGLPDSQLAWFADRGDKIVLDAGDRMFEYRQPSTYMFIIVKGAVQRFENLGGQWLVVATTRQGEVTGMLPYSRMTHYPGYSVATEPSEALRVRSSRFQEMLQMSHEMGQRLVAVMSDRVRGDVRLEQQQERMAALGRLSAGLAHELNNPAAAARRSADALSQELNRMSAPALELMSQPLDESSVAALDQLRRVTRETDSKDLSPLQRSEREEELAERLEDHGVGDAWEIVETLAEMGLAPDRLDDLAREIAEPVRAAGLRWAASAVVAERMVADISSSTARISELVSSIKIYSHMDRSPEHKPTDVREGLDNTLTMLSHKLKKKNVQLDREYQDDLPAIPANAGELNQVWTNLMDNALDAVGEGGSLLVIARKEDSSVAVKFVDNGPGIPDEVRARIFEPFFTTKAVGEGTGLGLDIAQRIAKTHQGAIEVQSKPGRTEVCVRLPIAPASIRCEAADTENDR